MLPPERIGDCDFAGDVHFAGHQRGERDRAAGLDHELQFGECEGDGGGDLGIARDDAGSDQRLIDGEGEFAWHARHQRVADCPA